MIAIGFVAVRTGLRVSAIETTIEALLLHERGPEAAHAGVDRRRAPLKSRVSRPRGRGR